MRILLVFVLLFFQLSTVASAGRSAVPQVSFESSQGLQDSGARPHHHEDAHDDGQEDDHRHRHSPEQPAHSHSHNHFCGNGHATYLASDVEFQLSPYLVPDLNFLTFDDKAAQSPCLSSVFRPPIV